MQPAAHDDERMLIDQDSSGSPQQPRLSVPSTAALLVADVVGTGILALPSNVHTVGLPFGLAFICAQVPLNQLAGCFLTHAANHVESAAPRSSPVADYRLLAAALAGRESRLARATSAAFFANLILILGNYLVAMSGAVQAILYDSHVCRSTAALIAAVLLLAVNQLPSLRELGRAPTAVSLASVVGLLAICLAPAAHKPADGADDDDGGGGDEFESVVRRGLRVAAALSGIVFAIGSQKLLLNIRAEMMQRAVRHLSALPRTRARVTTAPSRSARPPRCASRSACMPPPTSPSRCSRVLTRRAFCSTPSPTAPAGARRARCSSHTSSSLMRSTASASAPQSSRSAGARAHSSARPPRRRATTRDAARRSNGLR